MGVVQSAQSMLWGYGCQIPDADLVIDATADASVASLIERCRAPARADWPHVIATVVGHDARRGIVTVSRPGATGAGRDILRRLTLAARGHQHERLADVADDFFPLEARSQLFQPEPGCSSPTFVGSATELAALAGHLLDAGLCAIADAKGDAQETMVAGVVRLDPATNDRRLPALDWFGWPDDATAIDQTQGYEIRVTRLAIGQMRAECRRGLRLRGWLSGSNEAVTFKLGTTRKRHHLRH